MAKKKVGLRKIHEAYKEILFDILQREKVESFNVNFEGSGDDGQIEDSDLPKAVKDVVIKGCRVSQGSVWDSKTNKSIESWKEDCTVRDIVSSLCYEMLEITHGGWENDDGAWGHFFFDVKKRSIHLDHNERYTESHLYEHEF